jgi:hypothetical protein
VLQQSFQSAQFQCVGANANNGRSDCNMTRAAATLGNFTTLTAIRSSSWTDQNGRKQRAAKLANKIN